MVTWQDFDNDRLKAGQCFDFYLAIQWQLLFTAKFIQEFEVTLILQPVNYQNYRVRHLVSCVTSHLASDL